MHTLAASGDFYLLDALLKHNVDVNAPDKVAKIEFLISVLLRFEYLIRQINVQFFSRTACVQSIGLFWETRWLLSVIC